MTTQLYFIMCAGAALTIIEGTIWDAADVAVAAATSGASDLSIIRAADRQTVAILDGKVVQPTAHANDAEIGL